MHNSHFILWSNNTAALQVVGELITDNYAQYTFAEDSRVIWTAPAKGEALILPGVDASSSYPFKGKVKGRFQLPFTLSLPQTVELAGDKGTKSYRLPCSLSLRFTSVTVNYRIFTTINHGTLFSPDHM